jgi:hypothetical protein
MSYIESFTISLEEHICTSKIIGLAVGPPKLSEMWLNIHNPTTTKAVVTTP